MFSVEQAELSARCKCMKRGILQSQLLFVLHEISLYGIWNSFGKSSNCVRFNDQWRDEVSWKLTEKSHFSFLHTHFNLFTAESQPMIEELESHVSTPYKPHGEPFIKFEVRSDPIDTAPMVQDQIDLSSDFDNYSTCSEFFFSVSSSFACAFKWNSFIFQLPN